MADVRKMTMGEICEIADIPKETGRTRMKGLRWLGEVKGWARFDLPSTVRVAVHAEVMRQTGSSDVSVQAADFAAESLQNFINTPPFMISRKGIMGESTLLFRRSGIDSTSWRMTWCRSTDQALNELGSATADSINYHGLASFLFVNVGTVTDWAIDRIFDLQGISGNEATVPQ